MREYSYGIIPVRFIPQTGWEMLLIQHHGGHWAFPKGHADAHESPQQTAIRELQEETGLTIKRFLSEQTFIEDYFFSHHGKTIYKTVTYFLAEVEGLVTLQEAEVCDSIWLTPDQAIERITFKKCRALCHQAEQVLKHISINEALGPF
jgi:8-oxo-dGTP pyrophosphatase MutT (NUDIX family)